MRANSTVFDVIRQGVDRVNKLAEVAAHMPVSDPRCGRMTAEIFHLAAFQGAVGDWAESVSDWAESLVTPAADESPHALRLLPLPPPDDAA